MADHQNHIAITGASAGLGRSLALGLAGPNSRLFLCARNVERLEDVAKACRSKGAIASVAQVDMRKPSEISRWIAEIEDQNPLSMIIVNAGVFGGKAEHGEMETSAVTNSVISTNLTGAIICANKAAQFMRKRRNGKIVLISSLAAKLPNPDAASYSASKAGLTAYGTALREDLSDSNIDVVVVHPGHIDTAQTHQQIGPVPQMVSPSEAAKRIIEGIKSGRKDISFPVIARYWVMILSLLPWKLRLLLTRQHRFTVQNNPHDNLDE